MSKHQTVPRKLSKSPVRNKKGKPSKVSTRTVLQSHSYNGSLDIKADKLELTAIGEKFVKSLIGKRGCIKVYWNFMNFPAASTPTIPIAGKHIDIRHTACYEVTINEAFLRYLSTRPITFEVYMVNFKQEILMGRGDAIFKELMNSPNEPVFVSVEISNLEKALLVNNPTLFRIYGHLGITYNLKCDARNICKLMQKRCNKQDIETFMHSLVNNLMPKVDIDAIDEDYDSELIPDPISLIQVTENTVTPVEEQKMTEISSDLSSPEREPHAQTLNTTTKDDSTSERSAEPQKVKKRKKHTIVKRDIKTTSSEESLTHPNTLPEGKNRTKAEKPSTSKELKQDGSATKIKKTIGKSKKNDIADVKRILEEFAILSGEDPSIVNSPKWKEANLSKVYLRSYESQPVYYYPEVVIYIHSLKLYEDCAIMKDDSIKSFYLEYSFLTHEGVDMESQGMLKLPNNSLFKFNFKKTFPVDINANHADCKMLANMIREKKTIVVEVISEPVEDMRKVQSCEIVGYAEIGLFDLIQLEDNVLKAKFEVKNFKNTTENIGYLRITFSGIQAMRNVALQLLAPPNYLEKHRHCYNLQQALTPHVIT